jgi:hypothetical protein
MFNLFKRRNWKPEIIEEMQGSFGSLNVVVRNFSCMLDPISGRRRYPRGDFDFGPNFIEELHAQLGDFELLRQILAAGAPKTVYARLKGIPAIEIQIRGTAVRKAQFDDELAEALALILEANRISP